METCSVTLLLLGLVAFGVGTTHGFSTSPRYHGNTTTHWYRHSDTTSPPHAPSSTSSWWMWWTSTAHHNLAQSTTTAPDAQTGAVRLAGPSYGQGRVEIYANGQWGTVCDDNFNNYAALAVCRQLGFFSNPNPAVYGSNHFPGGDHLPILLDGFSCSGYETRLMDCQGGTHFGVHDCSHSEDAGVDCYGTFSNSTTTTTPWYWNSTTLPFWLSTPSAAYPEGSVRLVNGDTSSRGRVEIFISGRWGTVCDDNFDTRDALVVCRQLGWMYSNVTVYPDARFGAGYGDIWMDDVACNGYEGRLVDCGHNGNFGTNNCQHSEDVSVDCLAATGSNFSTVYYPPYSTTTNYWGHDTSTNIPGGAVHGATIQLTADPQDVVIGMTSRLTLTCAPGYRDDLSRILLIQINHDHNGTKTAVADIGSGQSARVVDGHYRTSASGYVPYDSYQQTQAYLTVTIDQPTEGDNGKWECTLSGLTHSNLMTTETATTTVHFSSLESVATELGELRRELETAESTIEYLRNNLLELQQARGQGFTAFLINNYTATAGRLPFQRELVDTLGVFSNSQLYPPENGLYFVTLTVSVNKGHHVTVALRQAGMTLLIVIASAGDGSDGQNSASAVVALQAGYQVDAEVIDFSPGAMLLASPSTLLSGYRL